MNDVARRIKRLLSLPSVENWARNNKPRFDDTLLALSNFDRNPPKFSLGPIKRICSSLARSKIDLAEALTEVEKIRHNTVRASGRQVIPALASYLNKNPIEGLDAFDNFRITYPIGRRPNGGTLFIPIIPTFVGIRDNNLCPVFIVPWADIKPFGDFQRTLMASILRDSLLSYQQFIDCDGEIVAFPKADGGPTRAIRRWSIRSHASMDREDLSAQFSKYGRALYAIIDEINRDSLSS